MHKRFFTLYNQRVQFPSRDGKAKVPTLLIFLILAPGPTALSVFAERRHICVSRRARCTSLMWQGIHRQTMPMRLSSRTTLRMTA
jgi:hypothetical protein